LQRVWHPLRSSRVSRRPIRSVQRNLALRVSCVWHRFPPGLRPLRRPARPVACAAFPRRSAWASAQEPPAPWQQRRPSAQGPRRRARRVVTTQASARMRPAQPPRSRRVRGGATWEARVSLQSDLMLPWMKRESSTLASFEREVKRVMCAQAAARRAAPRGRVGVGWSEPTSGAHGCSSPTHALHAVPSKAAWEPTQSS
jgi:hypothetical protein